MAKKVKQYFDDFEVFDEELIKNLENEVIGQRIEAIFAQHSMKNSTQFIISLSNGKSLRIVPTVGDRNCYLQTDIIYSYTL